ncbi:hypothetical protein GBAR_LOCUS30011, partial [Geodia barretti]
AKRERRLLLQAESVEYGQSTVSTRVSRSPDPRGCSGADPEEEKMSGLPGGGVRTSGVAPPNRRRTQVLAKGSRPSSSAVGPASHKRSSVYGHGGHSQPKKDPRPLSDRSFQISATKKLIAVSSIALAPVRPSSTTSPSLSFSSC